jgi:predicted Zn-dependent peptidase
VPAKIKRGDLRIEKDSEQLHLMVSFPAPSLYTKNAHVAGLLGTLLGGTSSSRLFQKVREKRGVAGAGSKESWF